MVSWYKLAVGDATFVKHADRGFGLDAEAVMFEIVEIDYFLNAGLNDGLGTFDAREVVDINTGTLEIPHVATEVKD